MKQKKIISLPISIKWDITSRCNLSCSHCRSTEFYSKNSSTKRKIADLNTKEIISILPELAGRGGDRIHFLGGEPLMRKDLPLIIKECSDIGIRASVNTNCTLLNNKVATALLNAGVCAVTFSLDGITASINDRIRGKGTFKASIENISNFVNLINENGYNCITNISYTLTKHNICDPTEILNFFSRFNVDFLSFAHLHITGNASKNKDDLLIGPLEEFDFMEKILLRSKYYAPLQVRFEFTPKIIEYFKLAHGLSIDMKYNGCKATVTEFYMQPDGALFPCQAITKNTKIFDILNFKYNMSLKNSSFQEIYNSNRFNEFGIHKNDPGYLDNYDPCYKCKYAYKICNPCPIPYFEGKSLTLDRCKIADDRIHKL